MYSAYITHAHTLHVTCTYSTYTHIHVHIPCIHGCTCTLQNANMHYTLTCTAYATQCRQRVHIHPCKCTSKLSGNELGSTHQMPSVSSSKGRLQSRVQHPCHKERVLVGMKRISTSEHVHVQGRDCTLTVCCMQCVCAYMHSTCAISSLYQYIAHMHLHAHVTVCVVAELNNKYTSLVYMLSYRIAAASNHYSIDCMLTCRYAGNWKLTQSAQQSPLPW